MQTYFIEKTGRVQMKNEASTIFMSSNVSELPSDGINR